MNKGTENLKGARLRTSGIRKKFRIGKHTLDVLKGVDFHADPGEWVALLGASGSGKTTLLDILGTISTPDSGKLWINDMETTALSSSSLVKFRQQQIGFVFQAYHILPELNILENVMLPMLFAGWSRSRASGRAMDLLDSAGLSHRVKHRPNELSGGEQQRAAIARALALSPALLLADEPTGNLDSDTGKGIMELFRNIHSSGETTIIMVTHDPHVAGLADRAVTLKDGKILK